MVRDSLKGQATTRQGLPVLNSHSKLATINYTGNLTSNRTTTTTTTTQVFN